MQVIHIGSVGRTSDVLLEFPVRLPVILKAIGMFIDGPGVTLDVEVPSAEGKTYLVPFRVRMLDSEPAFNLFHPLHYEAW